MENELTRQYFLWMVYKIFNDERLLQSYLDLLNKLNFTIFEWTLELDENRQKDAQDLRYAFGDECGYSAAQICQELDVTPPSLLEVIVALIYRVRENVLDGLDENVISNQEIFLDILKSLGIDGLHYELNFEQAQYLYNVICDLYCHNYAYNGKGGLFKVEKPKDDMRNTEIWYQFMWYLNEKLGGKYL